MTQAPPRLTDLAQLARNRARAEATGPALFLHDEARAEIEERLAMVNRTFTAPAVVTAHPQVWGDLLPDACVIPDSEVLDLEPGAHDLVIHAMGLHWSNDPVGQMVQARRALRPDGLFLGVMFGGQTLNELRAVLAEAEIAQTGGLSPRIAPMAEIRDIGALLQRAGFALPVADTVTQMVTYANALNLMRDLRAMGEGNALDARDRKTPPRAMFAEAAARYADAFPAEDGRIRATFEMVFLSGWAPDDSQQQPLRPGSAKMRLADALKVPELGTKDPATPRRD